MARHLLFVCSQNKLRSPTAEEIFCTYPGVEAQSAGLNNDAEVPLGEDQIAWADLILVMEKEHRERLNRKFGSCLAGKRVVVLHIPDNYDYMDEELCRLLRNRVRPYLP